MEREVFVPAHVDGGVLEIRLDRPERLNAVSEELYADLHRAIDAADGAGVGAVLLHGAGRAFCAGADLKAHATRERTQQERVAYVWAGQRACHRLQTLPVPVVAAVQGHAIGAGAELALSADLVVCAADATLRFPEVELGTFVGGGITARLPQLVGLARAKALIFLGQPVTAAQLHALGVALDVVEPEDLLDRARQLSQRLAALPPRSLRHAKALLNRGATSGVEEMLTAEAEALLACMVTADWTAGVDGFAGVHPEGGGA